MAFDTTSPNHPSQAGEAAMNAILENFLQLRKFEAATTAPANPVAGMFWVDTSGSPYVLKQRNDANSAWNTLWSTGTTPAFPSNTITTAMITALSVTAAKLASGAALANVGAGNITASYLASGAALANVGAGNITESYLASNAVSQGKLKSTTGEVSVLSSFSHITLPGGEYGFYPRLKVSASNNIIAAIAGSLLGSAPLRLGHGPFSSTSYLTNIAIGIQTGTLYAQQRYIQSSPPYKLGNQQWGHFVFVLRKKSTGEIIAMYEAQDPPWGNNGQQHLYKNDPERIAVVPHPFADYHNKPLPAELEIVLLDMNHISLQQVSEIKCDNESVMIKKAKRCIQNNSPVVWKKIKPKDIIDQKTKKKIGELEQHFSLNQLHEIVWAENDQVLIQMMKEEVTPQSLLEKIGKEIKIKPAKKDKAALGIPEAANFGMVEIYGVL